MTLVDNLQEDECRALLKGATHHPDPFIVLRDRALVAAFPGTGARVSELIHPDRKDVDLHAKRIRLHRKGGDVQALPLGDDVISFLGPYLKERRRRAHGRAAFVSIRGRRPTQPAISAAVHRCAVAARQPKTRITPHALRHSFACSLLAHGEDLQTIRVLMNDRSRSTTARHLHTQDEQLSVAVNGIALKVVDSIPTVGSMCKRLKARDFQELLGFSYCVKTSTHLLCPLLSSTFLRSVLTGAGWRW